MDEFTMIEKSLLAELKQNREALSGLIAGFEAIIAARAAEREHLVRIKVAAAKVVEYRATGYLQTAIDNLETQLISL